MVNGNWFNAFSNNQDDFFGNAPQILPTQVAPTQFQAPRVSPTRQYRQTNVTNTVVPHVHPSHLTTVNQQMMHHQHHFPHTTSVVNECCERHTMCGTPFRPRPCGCPRCRS